MVHLLRKVTACPSFMHITVQRSVPVQQKQPEKFLLHLILIMENPCTDVLWLHATMVTKRYAWLHTVHCLSILIIRSLPKQISRQIDAFISGFRVFSVMTKLPQTPHGSGPHKVLFLIFGPHKGLIVSFRSAQMNHTSPVNSSFKPNHKSYAWKRLLALFCF